MDLVKFRASAKRKQKSLSTFLDKLDKIVPPDLQDIADRADAAMWKETDCTTCANCCKTMTPTFTVKDINRISKHLGMKPKEFKDKWLLHEKETGDWVNKTQPCQFLENNMCSIYEVRPADCAGFPHHHLKPFDLYNDMFKANIMHCPATLSMVDRVKKEVDRRYDM